MGDVKRIVITGSGGFIGQVVCKCLEEAGHEVWGIDCAESPNNRSLKADLLDASQTKSALESIEEIDVLIHLAAIAHGQAPPAPHTIVSANVAMLKNVLQALSDQTRHLILASSVAVYGEDGREQPVFPSAQLRPSTVYGVSKQKCEDLVLNSEFPAVDILRFSPVYDEHHMKDVGKRVYLPGSGKLRMRLYPPPQYSLCHVNRVADQMLRCVTDSAKRRRITNVADKAPYVQHEILEWFDGPVLPFPVWFGLPLRIAGNLLPGARGYALRCLHAKLFKSNVYALADHFVRDQKLG